jgi:transposase-like protein
MVLVMLEGQAMTATPKGGPSMARHPDPAAPSCPRCRGTHVSKNGHKHGSQRWWCHHCQQTFGPTFGPPLYHLHTPAPEVAHSLLIVMRRGSYRAAEEITGHKAETLHLWLLRAADHADALTHALVHDLHLSLVEVDAFWPFVKKSRPTPPTPPRRRVGLAHAGAC